MDELDILLFMFKGLASDLSEKNQKLMDVYRAELKNLLWKF